MKQRISLCTTIQDRDQSSYPFIFVPIAFENGGSASVYALQPRYQHNVTLANR